MKERERTDNRGYVTDDEAERLIAPNRYITLYGQSGNEPKDEQLLSFCSVRGGLFYQAGLPGIIRLKSH